MKKDGVRFRKSVYVTLSFIIAIWMIKIFEYTLDFDLGSLGILPRTIKGSIGILTAPLIHGDIYHLLSNTFPIIFLGVGIFYFYDKIATIVIGLIYIMTGFWVWIAARDAYHIGASGVVYGMLTFLLFSGFIRRDTQTLSISFIVLFLYGGGFATGLVPTDAGISWESHLMGAIAGVFCAIYFKNFKLAQAKVEEEKVEESNITYRYQYLEKGNQAPSQGTTYTIKVSLSRET
ncbi:MAG: rhomboid family intramembrane serine protease, partial [Bacteroidota bacterium]